MCWVKPLNNRGGTVEEGQRAVVLNIGIRGQTGQDLHAIWRSTLGHVTPCAVTGMRRQPPIPIIGQPFPDQTETGYFCFIRR